MQWDYVTETETLDASELSKLGEEGWELVAVVSPSNFMFNYFFRCQAQA